MIERQIFWQLNQKAAMEMDENTNGGGAPCDTGMLNRESGDRRVVGHLNPYENGESFEDYLELANNFIAINGFNSDEEKVRIFISYMGSEGIKVINAFKPNDFAEKTFVEVITMCKKIFIADRKTFAERYKFNSRSQKKSENIEVFSRELQKMAETCDYDITFLDQALRNRFIAGLLGENIRTQLFTFGPSKTFKEVVDAAASIQKANHDAQAPSTSRITSPTLTSKSATSSNEPSRNNRRRIKCTCGKKAKNRIVRTKRNGNGWRMQFLQMGKWAKMRGLQARRPQQGQLPQRETSNVEFSQPISIKIKK